MRIVSNAMARARGSGYRCVGLAVGAAVAYSELVLVRMNAPVHLPLVNIPRGTGMARDALSEHRPKCESTLSHQNSLPTAKAGAYLLLRSSCDSATCRGDVNRITAALIPRAAGRTTKHFVASHCTIHAMLGWEGCAPLLAPTSISPIAWSIESKSHTSGF